MEKKNIKVCVVYRETWERTQWGCGRMKQSASTAVFQLCWGMQTQSEWFRSPKNGDCIFPKVAAKFPRVLWPWMWHCWHQWSGVIYRVLCLNPPILYVLHFCGKQWKGNKDEMCKNGLIKKTKKQRTLLNGYISRCGQVIASFWRCPRTRSYACLWYCVALKTMNFTGTDS